MINLAVILAAGLGSRLAEITHDKPKGFLMIEGKSLIGRSVDNIHNAGIEQIIIGTGYLSGQYEQFSLNHNGIQCVKNNNYRISGSMATLFNLRDYIKNDFLLLESDLLYGIDSLEYLLSDERDNLILCSGATNSGDEVYIEANKYNELVKMSKNKHELSSVFGELVGISKISLPKFNQMCDIVQSHDCINNVDYEDVLSMASFDNDPFYLRKIEDLVWCEIDDKEQLENALNSIVCKIDA